MSETEKDTRNAVDLGVTSTDLLDCKLWLRTQALFGSPEAILVLRLIKKLEEETMQLRNQVLLSNAKARHEADNT